jgi:serine-type D-Ala-D-Ala carboxypeptidase (penicillin-binding protein 5/6)
LRRRAAALALAGVLLAAPAAGQETRARQALLVEAGTGRVLFERAAGETMAPSSLAKLMLAYVAFEALETGTLKPNAEVRVSNRAVAARGSTLRLRAGERVGAILLLRAAIICSANDAAVALAEHMAGSENAFAERMNERAATLGLSGTRFLNATGHAADGQRTTAADMARLAGALIGRFPDRYPLFAERAMSYDGRVCGNRNPVLGRVPGADGLKTGMTAAGGYGLVASALRGNRRLILVLNGLPSETVRAEDAARLIEWGFAR